MALEVLEEKPEATSVFAPEFNYFTRTGAVVAVWDDKSSVADQLDALLASEDDFIDKRDERCAARNGRSKAFLIFRPFHDLA